MTVSPARRVRASLLLVVLIVVGGTARGRAQGLPAGAPPVPRADSLLVDSMRRPTAPTVRPERIAPTRGAALWQATRRPTTVTSDTLHWRDLRTVLDAVSLAPGFDARPLGSPGGLDRAFLDGLSLRESGEIRIDGRPISEPVTGGFDPNALPLGPAPFGLDALTGADALPLSTPVGLALTDEAPDTGSVPITRIRHRQGGYGYGDTRASFWTRVRPRVTALAEYAQSGSSARLYTGNPLTLDTRILHTRLESHRGVGRLVWGLPSGWRIGLTERYTLSQKGFLTNRSSLGPPVPSFQSSFLAHAGEAVRERHDADLSARGALIGAPVVAMLYTSVGRWTFSPYPTADSLRQAEPGADRYTRLGARVATEGVRRGPLALDLAAEGQLDDLHSTRLTRADSRRTDLAVAGRVTLTVSPGLVATGGARLAAVAGSAAPGATTVPTLAAGLRLGVGRSSLQVDGMLTQRLPSPAERLSATVIAGSEGLNRETISLLSGDLRLPIAGITPRLRGYIAVTTDPIEARRTVAEGAATEWMWVNGSATRTALGLDAAAAGRPTGWLYAEGKIGVSRIRGGTERQPPVRAEGGLFFWRSLFSRALDLKLGVQGRAWSGSDGERYLPDADAFVPNDGSPLVASHQLDAVLVGHVRDVHLSFVIRNLTDRTAPAIAGFPLELRTYRLGVDWDLFN